MADEKGLYLEVFPNGSKLWRVKYRFQGKEKRLALGAYPDVSLADARALRDDARKQISAGIDPGLERKLTKVAMRIAAGNSFSSVAEDFVRVKMEGKQKASATINKARWYLSHLESAIGSRPIAEIQPIEVLDALRKIERKGHRETANRTRAIASRVFRHGIVLSVCTNDPAAALGDALEKPIVKHRAAILEAKALGEFLRANHAYTGNPIVRLAMLIAPHVMLRPGELRMARWDEIDREARIWHVPADRTKQRKAHSLPISDQVMTLLDELAQHSGGCELAFIGRDSFNKPISGNTLNQAYRRMGFGKDEVTAHGLRATASTFLNQSGEFHPDAIERSLAHGDSDQVRAAYHRGTYWDERVRMMQWWSDYLDKLRVGGEVVPMPLSKTP